LLTKNPQHTEGESDKKCASRKRKRNSKSKHSKRKRKKKKLIFGFCKSTCTSRVFSHYNRSYDRVEADEMFPPENSNILHKREKGMREAQPEHLGKSSKYRVL